MGLPLCVGFRRASLRVTKWYNTGGGSCGLSGDERGVIPVFDEVAGRVFDRFRVELLDRGELRRVDVVAENEQQARRAAMGAARDLRQCEILAVAPRPRVGFA